MPELCGSTTLSASKVANAASAAVPPWRNMSTPAAAARGSAALTIPLATGPVATPRSIISACVGMAQALSERAAAIGKIRWNITRRLLAPDCIGNAGEPFLLEPLRQAFRDAADDARSFIDHRAVKLDEARARPNAGPGIIRILDAADADQRDLSAGRRPEV